MLDLGGYAAYAIVGIVGATAMLTVGSFFVEFPQVAFAGSAVFLYYGLKGADYALTWWNRSDLRTSVAIEPAAPQLAPNDDGTFNVSLGFLIINNSQYEIALLVDDESLSIGCQHAFIKRQTGANIIPPGASLPMKLGPVANVKSPTEETLDLRLCARFGPAKQRMNLRWWLAIEMDLVKPVGTAPSVGWRMRRNDFEGVEI